MTTSKDPRLFLMVSMLAFLASVPALGQAPSAATKSAPTDSAAPKAEPAKSKGTINIRIEGLRNDQGTVYVSLYDNEKAFKKNKDAVVSGHVRPAGGVCTLVFESIPPGRYALSFIHDENGNKKLDTSFVGIPKEGFGFSKDVMGRFGPPSFEAAALDVPAGSLSVVMKAKYM